MMLLIFNGLVIQTLEGYRWPLNWLLSRRKRKYAKRLTEQQSELATLCTELRADRLSRRVSSGNKLIRYDHLRAVLARLPSSPSDICPTQFGNAIRTFETYARDVYGADGVQVWPRLLVVVSKEHANAVADARSQVDCFVNILLLSLIAASISITSLIWHGVRSELHRPDIFWLGCEAVVSYLAYKCAVAAVPAWGSMVMAAFDCYLPRLAEQLDYILPKSDAKRRQFWAEFSDMIAYRTLPDGTMFFSPERWSFGARERTSHR